jgi:hypothetical protein
MSAARYETYLDTLEFATASRIGFNNSLSPTFLGNGYSITSQSTTGTPGFVQDHPFIPNGYSLGGSTGTIQYKYSEDNTADILRHRSTFGFWFKLTQTPTSTQTIYTSQGYSASAGLVNSHEIRITTSRTLTFVARNGAGSTITNGIEVLNLNQWYFISFALYSIREADTTRGYASIMINGVVDILSTAAITLFWLNRTTFNCDSRWRISEFIQGHIRFSTQNTARIYAAGIPDKQARQTILDSNPTIFYGTDIVNKTDLMPNLGSLPNTNINLNFSTTRGTSITVNQIGADDKGWTFLPSATTANNSVEAATGASRDALHAGMQSTFFNAPAVSFEFWYRIDELSFNISRQGIRTFQASSGGSGNQSLPFFIEIRSVNSTTSEGPGHVRADFVYPGTTSLVTGDASASVVNGKTRLRFDDGQWHHCVITFTKKTASTAANRQEVYIDGSLINARNYSTIDWTTFPTLQIPYSPFTFFQASALTADGLTRGIDSFIMYDRALPGAEVRDHYYAWLNQPDIGPTNYLRYWDGDSWETPSAQRVWNGTAWIDWDASYWNGTAWIDL